MKRKQALVLFIFLIGSFSAAIAARAEAPVVDLSRSSQSLPVNQALEIDQDDTPPLRTYSQQNETLDQRVVRLERQVANVAEMNFASKLERMQQEVQQLHGQIEVQTHDLAQLKEQVKNFYQDLDQRLSKSKSDNAVAGKKLANTEDVSSKAGAQSDMEDGNKNKELQAYEVAFNLLNKKEYDKAIIGFQAFLKNYPTSSYAVNAHYWLGEIYYLKDKSELANNEFQIIIDNYPDNPKVADAMLKVALIAMDLGNTTKAKQNLLKVQKQFPGTTAAKIATLRLKELKQKK